MPGYECCHEKFMYKGVTPQVCGGATTKDSMKIFAGYQKIILALYQEIKMI